MTTKPTRDEIVAKIEAMIEEENGHISAQIDNGLTAASCAGAAHILGDLLAFVEPKRSAEEIAGQAFGCALPGLHPESLLYYAETVVQALRDAGKLNE